MNYETIELDARDNFDYGSVLSQAKCLATTMKRHVRVLLPVQFNRPDISDIYTSHFLEYQKDGYVVVTGVTVVINVRASAESPTNNFQGG